MRFKDKIPSVAFVFAEAILFFSIQHTGGELCRALCYGSVLLALLHAIYVYLRTARGVFVVVALFFTAFADYCLVAMEDGPRILAMIFFSLAQLSYAVRLRSDNGKHLRGVAIRLGAVAVLEAAMLLVLGNSADVLTAVTMFYFANLLINLLAAFIRREGVLAAGLLAFLLCDVFVGLGVLAADYVGAAEGSLLYALTHTGINLVWLFYVPSQTLISLSGIIKRKDTQNG
jgi:hypothetical protein